MTTVTANLRDVAGISDNTRWLFTSILRESGGGDAIVTSRNVPVQPVLGVLTVDLDPGYCEVRFGGRKLAFDVPDTGSADLWDLIAAAIAFPPETRSQQVADAVLSYLDNNPIAWEDVDTPAVVAAGADLAAVWDVLGTVPTSKLPNLSIIDYLGTSANQAAMLALSGQKGDWCTRTDTGGAYIITGSDPTQLASWTALPYPTLDADLAAIGGLTSAANKVPYATGAGAWALADFTAAGRALVDDASAAAQRATLGATTVGGNVFTAADQPTARIATDSGLAQRARYGPRTVVDGDSITIGQSTTSTWNQSQGGWSMECARLSNGRIDVVHNAGIASTGIASRLTNFAANVAAYTPETIILAVGTNDINNGMSLSDFLTGLTSYYDLVRGIGAQLIVGGIYPKATSASTISVWNAAIVEWAKVRGVLVIPFWELADPTNGAWPAAWTSDGTHPLPDSGAFPALGKLAWQTVARPLTEPIAPTARYVGEGLYTNLFTDLTSTITGVATITGLASTTGTLAAGDYTYRVVAASHYGNSPTYADQLITLGGTGGVDVTSGASGSYSIRRVYRKGPGDATFYYIGKITLTGSQVFTDNGIAAGYAWFGGDSSRFPNGITNSMSGDSHTLAYGPPIFTDPDIRGNVLRLTRGEGSAAYRADLFTITGLTPAQQIVVSCKCRGANSAASESLRLRFLNSGNTVIDTVRLVDHRLGTDWGLVYGHAVVPAGVDHMMVSLEGALTSPYTDWAELRVA